MVWSHDYGPLLSLLALFVLLVLLPRNASCRGAVVRVQKLRSLELILDGLVTGLWSIIDKLKKWQ